MTDRARGRAATAATVAASAPLPPPPLGPQGRTHAAAAPHRRTQTTSMWSVVGGSSYCQINPDGACVTDGDGDYGSGERCTVRAEVALIASAQGDFSTERTFDYVTISGTRYSSTTGPTNVAMSAGEELLWNSDSTIWSAAGSRSVPYHRTRHRHHTHRQQHVSRRQVHSRLGQHGMPQLHRWLSLCRGVERAAAMPRLDAQAACTPTKVCWRASAT
jgi:hypothetical protein